MRAGTAFLLTLAVLLTAGVAADALVTRRAEEEASALVSDELGAPASVTLSGWPVGLRLAAGRVPEVRIVASDVPLGDVALQRFDARLFDVHVRLADLQGGAPARLRGAGGGSFVAEFDEEAVGLLAGAPGEVRLGEGVGQVRAGDASVDVAVSLEQGRIVLRPIGAAPEGVNPVEVTLPPLPGNPVLDEVRITRGLLRVSGQLVQLGPAELSRFSP